MPRTVAFPQPIATGAHPDFQAGLWRLADPKISLASLSSLFLSTAWAASVGSLHWGWLFITVTGILAIEVAKNASGELVDFDSGTDLAIKPAERSPFSGGKRVLVDGLLTRGQTAAIATVSYALGIAIGLWIAFAREPRVLAIGLLGVLLAHQYHSRPLRLAYRGLGELAVGFCYGPLIGVGNVLVQTGEVTPPFVYLSVPMGLLIGAFLWINEFPDYSADRGAGKRTLVVQLGRGPASFVLAGIVVVAFIVLGVLPLVGVPQGVWLAFAAAIPGILGITPLLIDPENMETILPAQVRTLQMFVAFAVLAGVGIFFWGNQG